MSDRFFERPILNSPYEYPDQHWELDESGQPTQKIIPTRRIADFITPIPKPKRRKKSKKDDDFMQADFGFEQQELTTEEQRYKTQDMINELRHQVNEWRIADPSKWGVTPETARLLKYWRYHEFNGIKPFFCQVEAVETAIWLTEVAPRAGKKGAHFLDHLYSANQEANPELSRLALKLATGAGKTTVMAMMIAWQTINAVRYPNSDRFTKGFLLVAPGITIRDRLRVLMPNDPDSYYKSREMVPEDMLPLLEQAKIVITNYHAFKRREKIEISKGGRAFLQGHGAPLNTTETDGQMLQRVMPDLMGMRHVMVINDEAHHCYREKQIKDDDTKLKGDEKTEADKNNEAARLWISGLEAINRQIGVRRVIDLSATPFFLSGSGYIEGTLFPWTMSDFSLMDAIECGIVKLPRVPIADNIPSEDMPMFRNLWEHVGKEMPKKGRGNTGELDPLSLPTKLQTALETLYGHYKTTFELWEQQNIKVPPCFIVVCNNTATSKLVYEFISGYRRETSDGDSRFTAGRLELFRNYDEHGHRMANPRTLLIDSQQLESGEALDKNFREMASDEIERFREEIVERTGDKKKAENLTDQDLLREVMNTVGREGALGGSIRCVVSVSMLTEGWDANNVTHVLGVRAFGTQLLCEQVMGRALRRWSYDLNDNNLFDVEYADVFGIPFDFTAKPVVSKPKPPKDTIHVKAITPGRDHLEITFPRIEGYRVALPDQRLKADFNEDSTLVLTPELVGSSKVKNSAIIGAIADLDLKHLEDQRRSTLIMEITNRLLQTKWRDENGEPKIHLFGQLKRISRQWLDKYLECKGGTFPAQLMYQALSDMACDRITDAINRGVSADKDDAKQLIRAIPSSYNPVGSTRHVNFRTSKEERWETSAQHCHVNWAILDSGWEGEFCRVLESHNKVLRYVKNQGLGLEVPYKYGAEKRTYIPDFIVVVDDGQDDPLNIIVEIKGYRREDAKVKKSTMETYWVPGVNNLKRFGRWAFAELTDVWEMEDDFDKKLAQELDKLITKVSE